MSVATISAIGTVYIWQDDNIFFYSNENNKTNSTEFYFPASIFTIDNELIVCFISDLTMSNVNNYFVCMSKNITFDGNNMCHTVTISGIENYEGLIKSNGYSDIIVKNITMKSINNSSLFNGGGWICQMKFGSEVILPIYFEDTGLEKNSSGCEIKNCSSDGEISNCSGGIVGSYSSATVENCHSVGKINGMQAGGIFGIHANAGVLGDCIAKNCYSTGEINGMFSGGIFGMFANVETSGKCIATNCHSEGKINGVSCGGIFGSYANDGASGSCIANQCYSIGDISCTNSGGIFSSQANNVSTGSCVSEDCYSTGIINGMQTGGIFGFGANYSASGSCLATKCRSIGDINGLNSGGIFGMIANYSASGNCTAIKCYSKGHINGSCSGGIFGMSTNYSASGTCNAKSCYSTGLINGNYSGGIFGTLINSLATVTGITNAIDCYSTGEINENAGGIFGSSVNVSSLGICNAVNCYSRGLIKGKFAGGIYASYANYNSNEGKCNAENCYSTGSISGDFTGGIFGYRSNTDLSAGSVGSSGSINAIDCYTSGAGNNNGIFTSNDANGKDNFSSNQIRGFQNYSEANNGNSGKWNNSNAKYTDSHQYGLYMSINKITQSNIWLIPNITNNILNQSLDCRIGEDIPFLLLSYDDELYNTNSSTVNTNQCTSLTVLGSGTNWFVNDDNVQMSNIEKGQLMASIGGIYNIYITNGFGDDLMSISGYNIGLFTLNVNIITENIVENIICEYSAENIICDCDCVEKNIEENIACNIVSGAQRKKTVLFAVEEVPKKSRLKALKAQQKITVYKKLFKL
jgi:hypothetical protein